LYDADSRMVYVSPRVFTRDAMETLHDQGYVAAPDPEHLLRHEVAHHHHNRAISSGRALLPPNAPMVGEVKQLVKNEISRYAAQLNKEMVAEVYALKIVGRDVSDEIEALYTRAGGPEVGGDE